MPFRRRGSDSDSSDDDSSSSGSSRSGSRWSKRTDSTGYSRKTTSSKAALKEDNWQIRVMKYVTGAPTGPVAIKKVTVRETFGWEDRQYRGGHFGDVSRTTYNDYNRYYYVPIKFDDSISVIDERRQRQASRQSSSSKSSKARKRGGARFVQQERFEEHEHFPPAYGAPGYDDEPPYDGPEPFYPPPPVQGQFRPSPMHAGVPPPPPPPPMGGGGGGGQAGFFNITGQGGARRDGWDDE